MAAKRTEFSTLWIEWTNGTCIKLHTWFNSYACTNSYAKKKYDENTITIFRRFVESLSNILIPSSVYCHNAFCIIWISWHEMLYTVPLAADSGKEKSLHHCHAYKSEWTKEKIESEKCTYIDKWLCVCCMLCAYCIFVCDLFALQLMSLVQYFILPATGLIIQMGKKTPWIKRQKNKRYFYSQWIFQVRTIFNSIIESMCISRFFTFISFLFDQVYLKMNNDTTNDKYITNEWNW